MKGLLLLLLFAPTVALADDYGGAAGRNSRGEIIHIEGNSADTIYVQKSKTDHQWKEQHELRVECPVFSDRLLSCLPGRKSPLSGVTYEVTTSRKYRPCNVDPYYDKSAGQVYICIKGCDNPRAPKIFHVFPWEC
ncbi:MAG TPA: hypothetical protein VK660_01070 [Xanthomonadaceae bacterium]|nr:hypothetical protein [Xanthomonadaceae bacterium]